jgi:hypothetical protein
MEQRFVVQARSTRTGAPAPVDVCNSCVRRAWKGAARRATDPVVISPDRILYVLAVSLLAHFTTSLWKTKETVCLSALDRYRCFDDQSDTMTLSVRKSDEQRFWTGGEFTGACVVVGSGIMWGRDCVVLQLRNAYPESWDG